MWVTRCLLLEESGWVLRLQFEMILIPRRQCERLEAGRPVKRPGQSWEGLGQDSGQGAGAETPEGTFRPHSPARLSLIYGLQAQGSTFRVMTLQWPCRSAAPLVLLGLAPGENNGNILPLAEDLSVLGLPWQALTLAQLQDLWGWFAVTGRFHFLNSPMRSVLVSAKKSSTFSSTYILSCLIHASCPLHCIPP